MLVAAWIPVLVAIGARAQNHSVYIEADKLLLADI